MKHKGSPAPLTDDVNIQYLADTYDLSGGEIAIVISNAAARAAIRGDKLFQNDLMEMCEDERGERFDHRAKKTIGFKLE